MMNDPVVFGRPSRKKRAQGGYIELGSTIVIVAILGTFVFMVATGKTWGSLSLLGKGMVIGVLLVSVIAAVLYNKATKWPKVDLREPGKEDKAPDRNKDKE